MGRKSFDFKTRNIVFDKLDGRCYYCGAILESRYSGWHVDHGFPVSKGGQNHFGNLEPCCPTCNLKKGNKTVEEFREYLGIDIFYFEVAHNVVGGYE